jgi:hypothetical protein
MNQPIPQLPPTTRTSTMAIISLIGGITGWTILPLLGSIVAVITGHIAHSEIKKGGGMITGKGMATAGLILGYLALAGGICVFCLVIILPLLGIGLSIPFLSTPVSTY